MAGEAPEPGPSRARVFAAVLLVGLFLAHQARLVTVVLAFVGFPLLFTVGVAGVSIVAEVVLGLAVTALGARAAGRKAGRGATVAAGVALLALTAWCVNFSPLAPRAYFALHRWEFGQAERAAPDERLAPHVAHLAIDGRTRDAGGGAVLLATWVGLTDNAGGYVRTRDEPPPGTTFELDGRAVRVEDCTRLGDGWWWC